MAVVYLALGSNVGDSRTFIDQAVALLESSVNSIKRAPMYVSKAVGYTEQPDFYNTALRGETELTPRQLLDFVKAVEKQIGRIYRFRWGPREIDIDIIFYDNLIIDEDDLHIPHLLCAERDFVLRPIADIDPGFHDPRTSRSVDELLQLLPGDQLSLRQGGN